jgi:hypothetical protein
MTRLSLLLAAAATVLMLSPAEARDGCGRGWFYNGRACVQADDDEGGWRYAPQYHGGYDRPRQYLRPASPYNQPRPVMGANGQISCNNPNYTWQDGACKPYRGPRGRW